MKTILRLFIPLTILFASCGNHDNKFVVGNWTVTNLNSVDSSMNIETLLNTFLVHNYSDSNILVFSSDNSLVMKDADGKELGKGVYKIVDNGNTIDIKFSTDKIESHYKITNKTDKTINMAAADNDEAANISLTKIVK
jgi:hypothetical protein